MCTTKEGVIKELVLASDLIKDAALNVSDDLFSGACVGIAKARYAIAQALSEIEQAVSAEDFVLPRALSFSAQGVNHGFWEIRR